MSCDPVGRARIATATNRNILIRNSSDSYSKPLTLRLRQDLKTPVQRDNLKYLIKDGAWIWTVRYGVKLNVYQVLVGKTDGQKQLGI